MSSEDEQKQKKVKVDGETPESLLFQRYQSLRRASDAVHQEIGATRERAAARRDKIVREILDDIAVKGVPRPPEFEVNFTNFQTIVIKYTTGEKKPRHYRKTYLLADGKSVCEKTDENSGMSWGYFDMTSYGGKPHQSAYCDRFAAAVAAKMTSEQQQDLTHLFRVLQ